MKTYPSLPRKNSGSTLVVSMILAAVLGTLLASFLTLTSFQVRSVDRSQHWNFSMVAAEAGVEEGLSMINLYAYSGGSISAWSSAASASGWVNSGSVYYLRRTNGPNYYDVYITNTASGPVIKSIGYTYVPKDGTYLKRAIQVETSGGSAFSGAMLAKHGIDINGGAKIDSYNSQNPLYNLNGQYYWWRRRANGNVGTIQSNVVAAIKDGGTARIWGQLATGPNSTITMYGTASVGDIPWVDAGTAGIKPGWSRNDLNLAIPDAPPLPSASYTLLPSEGNRTISASGGTAYYYASTTYHMNSDNYLLITNGTVVIDFREGLKMDANSTVIVARGSKLIMYLGNENSQLNGTGVVNPGGYATNCIVYGKTNCLQMVINGSSDFVGYVYAPQAEITMNGNANISGAMVGDSFQINGSMWFHYDESLAGPNSGGVSIYRIISWKEVNP